MNNTKHILGLCSVITMSEAERLLEDVCPDSLNVKIIWDNASWSFKDLVLYYKSRTLNNVGPFWFWCGPPGYDNWREGKACQFVADALLNTLDRYGEGALLGKVSKIFERV